VARIRSSKPEWWKSAKWCRLPRDIRATYKGIWEVMCDDQGRFLADPRQVKADVWPLDDDITPKKIAGWLPKLETVTVTTADGSKVPAVAFYRIDGVDYGFLPGFVKHQKISHPTPSKLPAPPGNNSGVIPEPLRKIPENFSPDKDRDLDRGVELERSGEEAPPLVVLPGEAERFLSLFYESPAMSEVARKRYRDVKAQLYDVLDPRHPGPKIRGGTRVKARSVEHLADELAAVIDNPPPDRDLAIVWVLKRLTNPPKGPSVTELKQREQAEERRLEDAYHAAAKQAGIRWANEHPEEYRKIVTALDSTYGSTANGFAKVARDAELVQRCARACDFPAFEEWTNLNQVSAA
jgi:hypothetical protein